MANIYKDNDKRKKVVPGGTQKPQEEPKQEKAVTAPAEEKKPAVDAQAPADILAGLQVDKTAAKSYAFYLSDGNVKKLKALAKKKGVSASKLLDHILSEVLI